MIRMRYRIPARHHPSQATMGLRNGTVHDGRLCMTARGPTRESVRRGERTSHLGRQDKETIGLGWMSCYLRQRTGISVDDRCVMVYAPLGIAWTSILLLIDSESAGFHVEAKLRDSALSAPHRVSIPLLAEHGTQLQYTSE